MRSAIPSTPTPYGRPPVQPSVHPRSRLQACAAQAHLMRYPRVHGHFILDPCYRLHFFVLLFFLLSPLSRTSCSAPFRLRSAFVAPDRSKKPRKAVLVTMLRPSSPNPPSPPRPLLIVIFILIIIVIIVIIIFSFP